MRLEIDMPEHQYNNIMAIDSMSLGRAPYKGIIMYAINAIKHGRVLKQEPTTKNDLGVDKFDKAINQSDLEEWIMETFPDWCEGDVRLIMNHMDEMPSVTPQEPKRGHWISHREHCESLGVMPSGLGAYEWCSNCDCSIDVREWHRNHYNYCPNCGADMREVK